MGDNGVKNARELTWQCPSCYQKFSTSAFSSCPHCGYKPQDIPLPRGVMCGRPFRLLGDPTTTLPAKLSPQERVITGLILWPFFWLLMHLVVWSQRGSYLRGESYFLIAQVFSLGQLGSDAWWLGPIVFSIIAATVAMFPRGNS
jgi:hypothetical protein